MSGTRVLFLVLFAMVYFPTWSKAQTAGDYRSAATGVNWGVNTSWETYNGSTWGAASDYPGQNAGAGTVTIRDGHTITINVSPANAIGALTVGEGASGTLTTSAANWSLTVTNNFTMAANSSFNLRRLALTVNGTSSVSGAVTDNNDNGSGTFTGLVTINNGGSISTANASPFTFKGGITNDGTFSFTGTSAVAFTTNNQAIGGSQAITIAGVVTVTGITVTNNNADLNLTSTAANSLTGTGGWIQGASSVLKVSGSSMNITTVDFNTNTNTVDYTRGGTQTVLSATYKNLTISTSGTKTLGGAVTVNNNFTIEGGTTFQPAGNSITVNGSSTIAGTFSETNTSGTNSFQDVDLSGGTISGTVTDVTNINGNLTMPTGDGIIGRSTLTITGTTTVATGRTLTINSNTGVKTFAGAVTISGSGTWTSTTVTTTANLVFRGGIDATSASGSLSAGGATFSTNDQNITGAGAISFANAVSISGARIITNTNTAGVTFNSTVDGTVAGATWKNGANGVTYYQPAATTQPMNTGVLDVSSTGNYFYYSRAGAQNVKIPASSYYHLYITGGGSSIKTLQSATSAGGSLQIEASTALDVSTFGITATGTTNIDGTFTDASNSGTNTFTGLLTVSSTGSLSTANNSPFIFEGGITNNGTFSQSGTGAVSFNTNDQNIDGTATMSFAGAITIAAGKTVIYNNTNASGITLSGILDGANASSTWKNDVNSTIYYQPVATTQPMNTGILDVSASGNNFYYSRTTGAQTIKTPSSAYHNLIISGGGSITKTLAGNTTVNGNLTIAASTTLDVDIVQDYSLTLNGNLVNSGTFQARSGTVTLDGTSNQALTTNSSSFFNLVIDNGATQVSLNDNLTVTNLLTLTDGVITTGSNKVFISNSSFSSMGGYSNTSFINGNLRRNIASNTDTYVFPVGNGTGTASYYRADMVNNNLTGITYIDSKFKPLTGHNDGEMDVYDIWGGGYLDYTTINTAGVWELEPNAAPSGGTYDIKLYLANMDGFTNNNFGPLKRPVGSTSGADWTTGGGLINNDDSPGRTVASGYMYRRNLNAFSEFGGGGGSGSGQGLPIELVSFTATPDGNEVKITWTTATEINNDFFMVERSTDAITFEALNVFEAAGNSSQPLQYSTVDSNPFPGTSYYRLKQVDYDGKFTYSDIVSVYVAPPEILFTVAPNPVTGNNFSIKIENTNNETSEDSTISLFDLSGKEILSNPFDISHQRQSFQLPANITKGTYLLVVNHSGKILSQKLTID